MMKEKRPNMSRREFLRRLGIGTGSAIALMAMEPLSVLAQQQKQEKATDNRMTYRVQHGTGEQISLLGFGMMRLPNNQDEVNQLVDYAIEHGVNYFDTSPAYSKGLSEHATGIALSRHKRDEYFIATKLSNFAPETQTREASIEMFQNSLKELQVDYIDYLLLHSIGGGTGEEAMELFRQRYIYNGILDYLMEQREKGVIRNLGFSYHGEIAVFDYLLENHDKYKWDFVQIELNYLDWKHAKEISEENTNAEYLYAELDKRGIPAVIMEPLLGGRLASLPQPLARKILARDPERTLASWAFRYAGSFPRVLTVLSGMTYMEHLKENLCTYCPLEELTDEDKEFLYGVAEEIVGYNTIPCNDCKYCMPCPYGIDIPGVLTHYNKCIAEGNLTRDRKDPDYARARRAFLIGYDRSVPKLRQADHCIGCGRCVEHCPQRIQIPREMERINNYVEALKQGIDRGLES
jgi:predicted aldo/keto reductase-like oxidoreductase